MTAANIAAIAQEVPACEAVKEIVETFTALPDWTERYQYLIELGRALPPFADTDRIERHRLHGCQARVWLVVEETGGRLNFRATSDSVIVAGLIGLLVSVYSGRTPEEILAIKADFIQTIGLAEHLSPHRANGLALMLERIRAAAEARVSDPGSGDRA